MLKSLKHKNTSGNLSAANSEVTDAAEPKVFFMTMSERKHYNKWRLRILTSVILGYAAYYLCRQNFSMIMPAFMSEFGYNKTEIGLMLTISSIVYGVGKFVNGYISDKSNARYFMPIGLFCSALVTVCLGFSNSLLFLGVFWVLNNWFQSMGWPPVARMLTHWFAPKELGTKWALGAASHQVGGAVTIVFSGYLVANFGWRSAFFVPGAVAALVALLLVNRLRESPEKLNLPTVEAYKGQEAFEEVGSEIYLPTMEIIRRVFANKRMWYICFANMFLYIVRLGMIYWGPLFLTEYKGLTITQAGWQVASYDIIGLAGGFSAGWLSDKVFHGQRGQVGGWFMLALAAALLMFWQIPAHYEFFNSIALILVGFFVYGPQVLAGVASADFASKKAIGTANGLVGAFGYIGSGLSGVCVGLLSDIWGWGASFLFFVVSALLGSVLFFLTTHADSSKKK
jgi:OPA family glycerol-3-phosphate transporter-like MFS transporter